MRVTPPRMTVKTSCHDDAHGAAPEPRGTALPSPRLTLRLFAPNGTSAACPIPRNRTYGSGSSRPPTCDRESANDGLQAEPRPHIPTSTWPSTPVPINRTLSSDPLLSAQHDAALGLKSGFRLAPRPVQVTTSVAAPAPWASGLGLPRVRRMDTGVGWPKNSYDEDEARPSRGRHHALKRADAVDNVALAQVRRLVARPGCGARGEIESARGGLA